MFTSSILVFVSEKRCTHTRLLNIHKMASVRPFPLSPPPPLPTHTLLSCPYCLFLCRFRYISFPTQFLSSSLSLCMSDSLGLSVSVSVVVAGAGAGGLGGGGASLSPYVSLCLSPSPPPPPPPPPPSVQGLTSSAEEANRDCRRGLT